MKRDVKREGVCIPRKVLIEFVGFLNKAIDWREDRIRDMHAECN